MISTQEFKKGARFEEDNAPWQVMDMTVHNPSARGSATLVKVKARNLMTGQVLQKTFKSGQMFEEPDLVKIRAQFLYDQGDELVFMDDDAYEQHSLTREKLGDAAEWLQEGFHVELVQYRGQVVNIELPASIEVKVRSVEPGARGDTATGKVMSRAMLENGVSIMVPAYVKEGSFIKVDPSTGAFLSRA